MRGNIVVAAAVAGGGVVVASIIFVVGVSIALNRSADQLADAVDRHAQQTNRAGAAAGAPIAESLQQLNAALTRHGDAIVASGRIISQPTVVMKSPVPIVDEQPLRVQGTVGVEVGENKESKEKNSGRK
jgi:hypothetical protein